MNLTTLKKYRLKAGLSQTELHHKSGVALNIIQRAEQGATTDMLVSNAIPLAKALGVSVEKMAGA